MDADGKTLGRLSTEIATLLQGKHKPIYVRHLNTGDYVVVVNAEKVRVTGKKLDQKVYYRHSGYPGGLKEETLRRVLDRTPTRAIRHAVKGMLPKNTVGRNMLSRLKLYVGDAHPHEAQVRGAQKAEERRLSAEADPAQEAEAETKPRTRARRRAVAPEAAPEAERTNEPSAQAEAIAEPPGQPAEAVAEPPEQPAEAVAEPPEQPKSTSEEPAEAVAESTEQPESTLEEPAGAQSEETGTDAEPSDPPKAVEEPEEA
jgi:large subunit ribosomal protein L13